MNNNIRKRILNAAAIQEFIWWIQEVQPARATEQSRAGIAAVKTSAGKRSDTQLDYVQGAQSTGRFHL